MPAPDACGIVGFGLVYGVMFGVLVRRDKLDEICTRHGGIADDLERTLRVWTSLGAIAEIGQITVTKTKACWLAMSFSIKAFAATCESCANMHYTRASIQQSRCSISQMQTFVNYAAEAWRICRKRRRELQRHQVPEPILGKEVEAAASAPQGWAAE